MKTAFLTFPLLILMVILSSPARALSSTSEISEEISAVLLSPIYSALVAEHVKLAKKSGKLLRISNLFLYQIGTETFAYVTLLQTPQAALGSWKAYGQIVSGIRFEGPRGEIRLDSMYFKAAEELP